MADEEYSPLCETLVAESDRAVTRFLLLSQAGVWAKAPVRRRARKAATTATGATGATGAQGKGKKKQQQQQQQKKQGQKKQQQKQGKKGQKQQQGGKKSKKQLNREKAEAAKKKAAERKAARAAKQQANNASAKQKKKGGSGGGSKWEEPAETPESHEKIVAALKAAGVEYTLTEHAAVRTSQEAADVRGVSLASGAKAMLLRPKGGDISMLIISAAVSLDMKKAAKLLGTSKKKLRMATPQDVYEQTQCVPGAVPPFGSVFGIPTFVDESLQAQGDTINFNAGLRTKSIKMSVADFMKVEKPTVAAFSS